MKSIKNIALSAMLTIGAFAAVTYTACNKDECKDVVCQNAGTCIGGTCVCPNGFEGNNCEILSSTKFLGAWRTSTESCSISGANAQYDINITASGSDQKMILISNLYNAALNTTATMTGTNTFVIDNQAFGSGTIVGSGTLSGSLLTITYSVTAGGSTDACTGVVYARI